MKQDTPTIMLYWVKAEIDHALKGIRERIAKHAATPGNIGPLRVCPAQLHQVAGALRIFDLMGVLRFTEALEAAFATVVSREKSDPRTIELLDRAVVALGDFVDGLSKGALNAPLRLFALYKELAALSGNVRVSRRDLFFPDIRISPPRHPSGLLLKAGALPTYLQTQRTRYQRGILTWLRNPQKPDGLQEMRQALDALDQVAPQLPEPRGLWWAATGLIDGLLAAPRPDWAALTKALCTKLDFQIRNLAAGARELDAQLLRDVLYALMAARAATARMREVRALYRFDSLLPGPEAGGAVEADPEWRQAALDEIQARLETIKGAWIEYASGKPQQLARFRELVAALKTKAGELESQPLARLLEVIDVVAARLPDPYPRDTQLMVMEMASAFLLVESIVEQFDELPADIDQQIVIMNGWLLDAAKTKTVCEPPAGLRADLIQKYNEAHLRAQVAREILANLQHAEEVLDAFARDPGLLDTLPGLDPVFRQIHGALIVLGFNRASDLLSACQKLIAEALLPDQDDTLKDIHWIAEGLSTICAYLEPCLRGRAPVDEPLKRFFERFAKRDGGTGSTGEDALVQPEGVLEKTQVITAAAAPAPEAPPVTAPAAQVEPMTPAAAAPDSATDEMVGIFLEEAGEVLGNITAAHAQVVARPDDRDALTTIRRGFHTLKGSGRMVGLVELGEVAWELEQVMNRWLERAQPASPALLELVASGAAAFANWVAQLKAGKPVAIAAEPIVETARELRNHDAAASPPDAKPLMNALSAVVPAAAEAIVPAPALAAAEEPAQEPEPVDAPVATPLEDSLPPIPDTEIPTLDPDAFESRFKISERPDPDAAPLASAEASAAGDPGAGDVGSLDFSAARTESDADVEIGPIKLSQNFYEIYVKEAQQHLDALEADSGALHAARPTDAFVRAAHTLASISRTAGFDPVAQLAGALEAWASHTRQPAGPGQREIVGAAVCRLREMVDAIVRRNLPQAATAEVAALQEETRQPMPGSMFGTRLPRPGTHAAEADIIARAAGVPQRDQRAIRDDFDAKLLPIFIEEAEQLLPQIGNDLRAWRADPADANISHSLKRALHTLKGSARMAGAMRLGELTHLMESAVEAALETGAPDAAVLDRLETQMDRLSHDIESLHAPAAPAVAAEAPTGPVVEAESAGDPAPARAETPLPNPAAMLRIGAEALDRMVNESGEITIARSRIEIELRTLKQSVLDLSDSVARLRTQLRELEIQADSQMQSRMSVVDQDRQDFDPLEFDRYTRLQELTCMMAEGLHDVVTVQQALLKNLDEADAALIQQSRVSRDLQQELMRVRTVPFASLTERLHRIVRQAARELGKKANLDISGSQIEIDRGVLERIGAPLEHLLRNAVAHGLEASAERAHLAKPGTGEIALALRQEGDEIVIVLSDDGAGLDLEKLRRKGLEKGLIEPAAGEAELAQLIFTPGFSTADEVTELSGRGIGMDVVRSEITAIGGRIATATDTGKGTQFTIYLPLTLAIMQAVLVRAGGQDLAIPSAMVEQVLRLKAHELAKLEAAGAAEFRGNRYRLHPLRGLIGSAATAGEPRAYESVLLLRSGTHRIALHVDELLRNQEIVIKNIGAQLSRVPWISGATVLADGAIVLIVNPVLLAETSRPVAAVQPAAPAADPQPQSPVVMVVDDSLTVRKVTGRLLEREGYRVLTAKDGVDALEQVGSTVPDVMLVDIEMPRMDGFDLARNIRGNPTTAGAPIIMISSRSAEKHRNHALEVGVNAFIGKPYQEAELLAQIIDFTGNRRRQAVYH